MLLRSHSHFHIQSRSRRRRVRVHDGVGAGSENHASVGVPARSARPGPAMAAAVVGGMVASGVIKVVIRQIGSAIVGKVKLHKNLTKDLQKMKMTLGGGRAQRRREVVHHGQLGAPLGGMRKKINMPDKMKKMQERRQKITQDHQNYSVPPEIRTNDQQVLDIWENAGNVEEAEIIGRTGDKLEILARLSGSTTEGTTFVPIWGFGGIGKTTLARSVYNHPEGASATNHFAEVCDIWLY
nr:uncharacterized protein LOC123495041 isoform X2 [Aegilops tauschii subsp. strangulata]